MHLDAGSVLDGRHVDHRTTDDERAVDVEQGLGGRIDVLVGEHAILGEPDEVEIVRAGVEDRLQVGPVPVELVQPGEEVLLELLVVAGQRLDGGDLGVDVGSGADPRCALCHRRMRRRNVDQQPTPSAIVDGDSTLEA